MSPSRLIPPLAGLAFPALTSAASSTPRPVLVAFDEAGALWLLALGVAAYLFATGGHNRHDKHRR